MIIVVKATSSGSVATLNYCKTRVAGDNYVARGETPKEALQDLVRHYKEVFENFLVEF